MVSAVSDDRALGALHKMIVERHTYHVQFDGGESARLERYLHEQAQPEWEQANAGEPLPPLTMEEAIHGLVMDELERMERKYGLVGCLDGTCMPLAEATARSWGRRKHDGKRIPLRVRWAQLICPHPTVTYHGHPDQPAGLCLSCGKVKPRGR